jgi:hypothetical protein
MTDAARGVSISGFESPNTVVLGRRSSRPILSAVTTTSDTEVEIGGEGSAA